MKNLLLFILLATTLASCATTSGYVAQKNPNKRGSSKGHRCGYTKGGYVNSIRR